ncbi:hypothetical protein [Bradyrhizobium guangdongense]|uniref:hypothetical protein n=1 Tax=Bradyrhizobium guangdongense TaxID=1325090 RepID=UPI00131A33E2|nr:hypothetical protein [Bradyrhizobium guangdongense]
MDLLEILGDARPHALELVSPALTIAIRQPRSAAGLINHSDCGMPCAPKEHPTRQSNQKTNSGKIETGHC